MSEKTKADAAGVQRPVIGPLRISIAIASHEGHRSQQLVISRDMAACLAQSLISALHETTGDDRAGTYEIVCGGVEFGNRVRVSR